MHDACGVNAWPPDLNDDRRVDDADLNVMGDHFGESVPPAPLRYDIGPDPAGDLFVDFSDIGRASNYHGQPPCVDTNPPPDADGDGFSDAIEAHVGTNPNDGCGANAWPPDINNDTFVDFSDIGAATQHDNQPVPPAPVRVDMSPDPNFDNFINDFDYAPMQQRFGQSCGTP